MEKARLGLSRKGDGGLAKETLELSAISELGDCGRQPVNLFYDISEYLD